MIRSRLQRGVLPALAICVALTVAAQAQDQTTPPEGLRENNPAAHALINARIVTGPGQLIESGTVVIRDGLIKAVGADVQIPADARVWDLEGKTIYPGLIDAFSEVSPSEEATPAAETNYWNPNVRPDIQASSYYVSNSSTNSDYRSQGVTARMIAPSAGVVRGQSGVVTTGDDDLAKAILNDSVALHAQLTPNRGGGGFGGGRGGGQRTYPSSPMGAMTLVRQAFYDAKWYAQVWEAYNAGQEGVSRPERTEVLEAMQPYLNGSMVVFDAPSYLYALRADQVAREFGLNAAILSEGGDEYRRLDAMKELGRLFIVSVNFPDAPDVSTPEKAAGVTVERMMHWDTAPENPGRLASAGIPIALSTNGLSDVGDFLDNVRKAVARGLDADQALAAMTTVPAEAFGMSDRLGNVAAGMSANLVVTSGDLFDNDTDVLETWVDGTRYEVESTPAVKATGEWEIAFNAPGGESQSLKLVVSENGSRTSAKLDRGETSVNLRNVSLSESVFTATFTGEDFGYDGVVLMSATLDMAPDGDEKPAMLGTFVWADGHRSSLTAEQIATSETTPASLEAAPQDPPQGRRGRGRRGNRGQNAEGANDSNSNLPAMYPVNYPYGAFGRSEQPQPPAAVMFTNATVWTCGPEGILENASVLVENGRISAVGKDLQAPEGCVTIDCTGKHISPGIIDCHSHSATDGGVNEGSQSITAEVRIGDFINCDDVNIYRQLAGGVTAANVLHGSANTIGGQNQVIKMRWGMLPEEMKFSQAPEGVKFALGENVTRKRSQDSTRYPRSRMGVEQLVRDAFTAAKAYRKRWEEWNANQQGTPPRVDLELEALAEIVFGERLIHCHSYRQDEILALMRTCEDYGVTIATFQHILEGYKVAETMAEHGVGGSSFSDWWAYKWEAYDAIPHNGAIMHNVGVVVSFNSDSAELARRLNTEAAKAVKYGGVPEAEALKFVTLNPAIQLGVGDYVGSLEPGKHADLVVWNHSPLSSYAVAQQTWIDGRKYFDREDDLAKREQVREMHAALVQRILSSGATMGGNNAAGPNPDTIWETDDYSCQHAHADGDYFGIMGHLDDVFDLHGHEDHDHADHNHDH